LRDFNAQFYGDVKKYSVVKHVAQLGKGTNLVNIYDAQIVNNNDVKHKYSYELQADLIIKSQTDGVTVHIKDIPFIVKSPTSRSRKDCVLNKVGSWELDQRCYQYRELTKLCVVLSAEDYPQVVKNYKDIKCID
jgi:hypothetical protein